MSTEHQIKADVKQKINRIFQKKKQHLGIEVKLEIHFLENAPIIGENIYGESFPFENPPRVRLEVFAPDVTRKEIIETICHELIHIKYPNLNHEDKEFLEKIVHCKEF